MSANHIKWFDVVDTATPDEPLLRLRAHHMYELQASATDAGVRRYGFPRQLELRLDACTTPAMCIWRGLVRGEPGRLP